MKQLTVCINDRANPNQPSCTGRGGGEVLAKRFEQEIAASGWSIEVKRFKCLGRCDEGPVLKLSPGGPFIYQVHPDDLDETLKQIEIFLA